MYLRFRGENPFMSGKASRRSAASRSITFAPQPDRSCLSRITRTFRGRPLHIPKLGASSRSALNPAGAAKRSSVGRTLSKRSTRKSFTSPLR